MRLLYLWLAVVIFTVIPNNKALSKQKNVFKITIVDRPRYSSTLDITFYDDSASFKLMDLHKVKINNAKKKSASDDCFDYVWVSRTINDIEDSTSNYLRKSILDFFVMKTNQFTNTIKNWNIHIRMIQAQRICT